MSTAVTPSFVMQYERDMRVINENAYMGMLADENAWFARVARPFQSFRKTDRITWFLNNAMIRPIGPTGAGGMDFQSLVTQTVEYPSFKHGVGIKVQVDQLEDLDGTGLNELATWSKDVGVQTAYYPQQLGSMAILNGANTDGSATTYDGLPFFMDNTAATGNPSGDAAYSNGHYYNPYQPPLGGYYNWLHGAAVPATANTVTGHQFYPGALPIDDSVTADIALQNLGKAIAYTMSIKQANGVQPRFLKVAYIIAPPRMAPRLRLLMNANELALAAAGGAGSADVKAVIAGFGLGTPIIASEFGSNFSFTMPMPFSQANLVGNTTGNITYLNETATGNDTTYYIVMTENRTTQLGGLLHVKRKPFAIRYFGEGGQSVLDAMLSRSDEIEYQCKGRMAVQLGHPFAIFRFDGS
jgi:hypothetical protein